MGWFRNSTQPEDGGAPAPDDRLAAIGPGVPGRCPSCDGLGYIDAIDIGHRYQIQHCKDCGHRWEYLFDAGGRLVGLTELDERGQPVARTRVRPRPAPAAPPPPEPVSVSEPTEPLSVETDAEDTDVIDLRDPIAGPVPADPAPPTTPEEMSPAEWLRHSRRR
jgi:hypothetical protein